MERPGSCLRLDQLCVCSGFVLISLMNLTKCRKFHDRLSDRVLFRPPWTEDVLLTVLECCASTSAEMVWVPSLETRSTVWTACSTLLKLILFEDFLSSPVGFWVSVSCGASSNVEVCVSV